MAARLEGKSIVVTGGSRGLGAAIGAAYVAAGARIVTCGRGEPPADLSPAVTWLTADVADDRDVGRLCAASVQTLGRIDVLVNNAGVIAGGSVASTSDAVWNQIMDVNVKGLFQCCRSFIPVMAAAGGGSIINLSSISGLVADPQFAVYNASKAFVIGLTRSIAVDHGKEGIRCNAICPGWIVTDMLEPSLAAARDKIAAKQDALRRHGLGRLGQPTDIAAAAVYLASEDSVFVSGQTLVVDGGVTAATPVRPDFY